MPYAPWSQVGPCIHTLKILRNLFLSLTILCFSFGAQAATLNEMLVDAYYKNASLKAERAALKAVDENISQAFSAWLPSIVGSYDKAKEWETVSGNTSTQHPETRALTLTQPVFEGGRKWAAYDQAEYQILSARESLRRVEQEVLLAAVAAYLGVVEAREVLEISKHNEKVLDEHYNATKKRFELGDATLTDTAQSEARLAQALAERLQAEGDLEIANAEFERVFWVPVPDTLDMPTEHPETTESLTEAIDLAMDSNPTALESLYSLRAAEENISVEKSALFPTLNLQGSMQERSGLGSNAFVNEIDTDSIGFQVSVPLYQSGAEYSRIRQARKNATSAEYDYERARNLVVSDTSKAWQSVLTANASIKATEANIKAAKVALDGVIEERSAGKRTVLDVLDAEQELFNANVAHVNAKSSLVLSHYELMSAIGRLNAQSLGLDVVAYDPTQHYEKIKYKFIGF